MTTDSLPMTREICYQCHIVFWVPTSFHDQCYAQRPHKSFWCPAGHSQHYLGESDVDKERRLRQRAEQQNARLAEEAAALERAKQKVEQILTRERKRTAAGVCPCCTRSFANMGRHMKTKHPDYAGATA